MESPRLAHWLRATWSHPLSTLAWDSMGSTTPCTLHVTTSNMGSAMASAQATDNMATLPS